MLILNDLKKTYRTGLAKKVTAVDGVSLEIKDGESVAITGKSGAGKSTLLNIIAGLDLPDSGEIILDGQRIKTSSAQSLSKYRSRNIGFVVQNYGLLDHLTVLENVILPLRYFSRGMTKVEKRRKAQLLLKNMGIAELASKYPPQLSGGECQRAAIARALIKDPKIILADEPTGSLDDENEKTVLEIFRELKEENKTVIIVTHDQSVAQSCDRVIKLENGSIVQ